jgi:hypothetical protein
MNKILKILIASCLIISFVSNAKLIRGGGRGSGTSSTSDDYYLIGDIHRNSVGIDEAYFDSGAFPSVTISGGIDTAFAAPTECVDYNILEENERRAAAGVDLLEEEPCVWEFEQNENLVLYGDFLLYFADADLVDVNWLISDGVNDWNFAGTVNPDSNYLLPDGELADRAGMVFLDVPMPFDMGVGDYVVSVQVTQYSGLDASFYSLNVHDFPSFNCDDTVTPNICGYSLSPRDSLSSYSKTELLRIVAQAPILVSSPATVFICLFFIVGLLAKNKMKRELI